MYMNSLNSALVDNNWATCDSVVSYISKFQIRYGEKIIPKDYKIELEVLYNKLNIFSNLFMYYFIIGFIFLIILIIRIFKNNSLDKLLKFIFFLIILGFIVQTLGLAARWVISGHAPC